VHVPRAVRSAVGRLFGVDDLGDRDAHRLEDGGDIARQLARRALAKLGVGDDHLAVGADRAEEAHEVVAVALVALRLAARPLGQHVERQQALRGAGGACTLVLLEQQLGRLDLPAGERGVVGRLGDGGDGRHGVGGA